MHFQAIPRSEWHDQQNEGEQIKEKQVVGSCWGNHVLKLKKNNERGETKIKRNLTNLSTNCNAGTGPHVELIQAN